MEILIMFAAPQPEDGFHVPLGVAVLRDAEDEDRLESYRFYIFYSREQGRAFIERSHCDPCQEENMEELSTSVLPERDVHNRAEALMAQGEPAVTLYEALCAASEAADDIDLEGLTLFTIMGESVSSYAYACWAMSTSVGDTIACMVFYSLKQFRDCADELGLSIVHRTDYLVRLAESGVPDTSEIENSVLLGEVAGAVWQGLAVCLQKAQAQLVMIDTENREALQQEGIDPSLLQHVATGND